MRARRRRRNEAARPRTSATPHPSFRVLRDENELRTATERAAAAERESARRLEQRAQRYDQVFDEDTQA